MPASQLGRAQNLRKVRYVGLKLLQVCSDLVPLLLVELFRRVDLVGAVALIPATRGLGKPLKSVIARSGRNLDVAVSRELVLED